MYITIGSHALRHWFPDFHRTPYDLDQVSINETKRSHLYELNPLPILFDYCSEPIASPEVLLTLKMSHAFWDIKWFKTMGDIAFLQNKKVEYIPDLFEKLFAHWQIQYGFKKVNLNKPKNEFFNDNVKRVIDHDTLHELIAEKPMYKSILKEGSDVLVDYSKLLNLPFENKLELAREEIYVIALERYLLTNIAKTKTGAYKQATKLIVTKLTKGWFPELIVKNYNLLALPDCDYYSKYAKKIITL